MTDKTQMEALNIIRDAYDLLMGRAFFFYNIASQFALKSTTKDQCRTMGVAHVDGVHWLAYNPNFIKYYTYKEISVILEHEIHTLLSTMLNTLIVQDLAVRYSRTKRKQPML